MTVAEVEGLVRPMFGEGSTAAVMVRWRGANSYFGRRKRGKKDDGVTREAAVRADGVAEFWQGDNGFGCVCYGSGAGLDPFGDLEVSFCVLHVSVSTKFLLKLDKLKENY